jgi:AcrR family transcriptional regulator
MSPRRIGATDSKTRAQLVDAAERLMLRDGYAAVTSRRVGQEAGISAQLVHYYFATMDDLFLAVFQRRADAAIARFRAAMEAGPSLRTIWELRGDTPSAAFTLEFAALANHRKAIRAEVARYAEQYRALELEALAAVVAERGWPLPDDISPHALLTTLTGISQIIALEENLGLTRGHEEIVALIERRLGELEPRPRGVENG